MKNKRFLILSLIAALSLSSMAGCGDNKDSSSENESSNSSSVDATVGVTIDEEALIKQPVAFYYPTDSVEDATKNALDAADPTKAADESESDSSKSSDNESSSSNNDSSESEESNGNSGESATKYVAVTEANGEDKTESVKVTDPEGQPVTDDAGEDVTEFVKVTEAVPDDNNNSNNSGSEVIKPTAADYEPFMGESYAIWLDISKDADYTFNGEFIEVTFKIKEDAPAGVYDVNITNPDMANIFKGGTTVKPDTVEGGKVFIGKKAEKQREFTDADGFAVYGEYIEANPGDEVKFRFFMNNNPGLVAINFHYEFDRNAMDIIDAQSVGEFGKIARTSFGDSPVLN